MNIKESVFPVLAGLFLAGCATLAPLEPGAENVVIRIGKVPDNCEFIAGIMGAQKLKNQPAMTNELTRDLKNNAARKGGNTVILYGYGGEILNVGDDYFNQFQIGGVTYPALVYQCPDEEYRKEYEQEFLKEIE